MKFIISLVSQTLSEDTESPGDDFVFAALVAESVIVAGAGAGGGLGIDSISCYSQVSYSKDAVVHGRGHRDECIG